MKRFTLEQVAKANIRVNRKVYISLFLGILTAVFLATAAILCSWGTIRCHEEQMAQRVGWMDMFLLGNDGLSDERLRSSGFFREIGHVTVSAVTEDSRICAGYYDETAERLMNRTLTEGRLPEKAGEIAAERSALIRLGMEDIRTGETLKLSMRPIGGSGEEKTFTLTGILNEQTDYLETYEDEEEGMHLPALLVSPEEAWQSGGEVVHRVMTYMPLITFNQVIRHAPEQLGKGQLGMAYGVSRESGRIVYYDSGWERAANILNRILVWAVLGAALMLSACVAITSAMESLLGRKTEDIGMLRAIGATRRQIRRIYGAEAWLLTATALPAGLALGVTAAWIVSRIAPEQIVFSLNIWLLVPILGLSALCVFIASRVPLYQASRQMPMGVLRDTAMLRRAGRVRNHRTFRPAGLIAGRRTRLHPLRQLGAAGMISLTLLCTLMLCELALGMNLAKLDNLPAFRLYGESREYIDDPFTQAIPDSTLSRDEMNGLRAIDGVSGVRSVTSITANILLDKVPEYFRMHTFRYPTPDGAFNVSSFGILDGLWGSGTDWLFWSEEDLADARSRKDGDWTVAQSVENVEQMDVIRELLGITEMVVPVNVYIADLDEKELGAFVADGAIDMEKLDSGEQALVYAPALCLKKEGDAYRSEIFLMPGQIREEEWDLVIRNDTFTAGMPLNLLEITEKTTGYQGYEEEIPAADWETMFRSRKTVQAGTSIGAVLAGPVRINESYLSSFSVILSPKGAEALGLELNNPEYTSIFLSGNPTKEEEERISEQISQTALRGRMDLRNQLEITRAYKAKKLRQILLCSALILLFFAVSVLMQVSDAARQIRAETRTLGTLRAVGADLKTLVGCYRLPVWICAAAAMFPCLLFYAVSRIPALRLFTEYHPQIVIPVLLLLAACVALTCMAGIRKHLAGVTRRSIVDNIREL